MTTLNLPDEVIEEVFEATETGYDEDDLDFTQEAIDDFNEQQGFDRD